MKICDIHSHTLPGVDHGAENMETGLQMLRNAEASEVAYLALTPHFDVADTPAELLWERMQSQFALFQAAAKEIPVQLALGAEVHISPQLMDILEYLRLPTINGSRYLLTEFPVFYPENRFVPVLEKLLQQNYIPLIAHPERYLAVMQQPWITEQWLDMGCHLQVTGGSLMGHNGKNIRQTAMELLQRDLVACIASDAHGVRERTNYLMGVYDHLSVHFSKAYAQCLLERNPLRIWQDENL